VPVQAARNCIQRDFFGRRGVLLPVTALETSFQRNGHIKCTSVANTPAVLLFSHLVQQMLPNASRDSVRTAVLSAMKRVRKNKFPEAHQAAKEAKNRDARARPSQSHRAVPSFESVRDLGDSRKATYTIASKRYAAGYVFDFDWLLFFTALISYTARRSSATFSMNSFVKNVTTTRSNTSALCMR
jgi:hypothetical protein